MQTKTKHTQFGELTYSEYANLMSALSNKDFLTMDEATVSSTSGVLACSASSSCQGLISLS